MQLSQAPTYTYCCAGRFRAGFAGVGLKLYNSGTINGAVNTSSFDDQLVNTGHLSGDVWLGGGN